MADANDTIFARRLQRIEKRHRKLAHGYVRLKNVDGLLIPVPGRRLHRRSFPLAGLLMTLAALTAFKAFLLAYHGPIIYAGNLDILASGNAAERAGAWIMSADPLTRWLAGQFALLPTLW